MSDQERYTAHVNMERQARSSKNWFRSPQRFFLDAPKQQPGTCFVKNDDYVEATDEIERLQREVNELELTHRVKDNKDLAARDLAELRPCYSVTGLETFIAKHFPALELRERTAHEPCDALALATRFHETYERLAPSFGYETRPDTKTFDPESKNGRLMVAVCREIGAALPPSDDAARYQWLRSRIAPSILSRILSQHRDELIDGRPEALDAEIDRRLGLTKQPGYMGDINGAGCDPDVP